MTHNVFVLKQKIKKKPINLPLNDISKKITLKDITEYFLFYIFFIELFLNNLKIK